jgi:phage FluMu gp28-like protein
MKPKENYFLDYQRRWIEDTSSLKIMEKSRQIGMTHAAAFSAVQRVATKGARLDVWVSSRDDGQARLFLQDCKAWARVLNVAAKDLGELIFDREENFRAYVLEFRTGVRIYSLSSNPNALAGKRGHVILDEFALHKDQRLLYRIAKPVTTWGGQLELISTHRGVGTVFNEILRDIRERNNPMGWSHHKVTLQEAVDQGVLAKINEKAGREESREKYMARIQAECLDEEHWLQEYGCVPADESAVFITHDLMAACEGDDCLKDFEYLKHCENRLYLGFDVGRKHDLSVIDVGEKVGDVVWDRMRIELAGKSFSEQEAELYRLLELPKMRRACIDATGMGMQLAERAKHRFGWKVEAVNFTASLKEEMAYDLRMAFEDRTVRIVHDPVLRSDLRGIKKEVTSSGNIRFIGESADSHCDRFWAKALRQHAAKKRYGNFGAAVLLEGGVWTTYCDDNGD